MADIIVAKHRNGPLGTAELFFNERRTSFENPTKDFEDAQIPQDIF